MQTQSNMDTAPTQSTSLLGTIPSAEPIYYLELSKDPIRFDAVSTLTNVFFDDTNRQVFAVRSGGATGIVVKGPQADSETYSFCMDDKGPIRSIKFSPDHRILAVQRADAEVEFITFAPQRNQPSPNEALVHRGKYGMIYGFVWIGAQEVAVISSGGIELYNVNMERRQIKSVKSVNMSIDWFSWNAQSSLAVLATNHGEMLWPVLLKPGTITKLPKLVWDNYRKVLERDLTLANIYGVSAILILQPNASRLMEVVVYLLNGPGMAPRKAHILRLGLSGRFAMNIADDLILVHHQATSTSLLFDIGLTGTTDAHHVTSHDPITGARSIRPITLALPSLSFVSQTKSCELYSANWVLFQPDIVIDAKLGCLWYVGLKLDAMCLLMTNRVRLVEFLLQRSDGKPAIMEMLKQMLTTDYNGGAMLPVLATIFDRLNAVYERSVTAELQSQTAQPSSFKAAPVIKSKYAAPRVLIDQNDLFNGVFTPLIDSDHIGAVLILYLSSLARLKIVAQDDLSRMIVRNLVQHQQLDVLRKLLDCSLLHESKMLACFLLSLSGTHRAIKQMALDMLHRLKDDNMLVEVLLNQGKVIDALRLASTMSGADTLPARKYLEAAHKTGDSIVFYSVYSHFVERNARLRGSPDFLDNDLCSEYIDHYRDLFVI